jgi:hypothetical protein
MTDRVPSKVTMCEARPGERFLVWPCGNCRGCRRWEELYAIPNRVDDLAALKTVHETPGRTDQEVRELFSKPADATRNRAAWVYARITREETDALEHALYDGAPSHEQILAMQAFLRRVFESFDHQAGYVE